MYMSCTCKYHTYMYMYLTCTFVLYTCTCIKYNVHEVHYVYNNVYIHEVHGHV